MNHVADVANVAVVRRHLKNDTRARQPRDTLGAGPINKSRRHRLSIKPGRARVGDTYAQLNIAQPVGSGRARKNGRQAVADACPDSAPHQSVVGHFEFSFSACR